MCVCVCVIGRHLVVDCSAVQCRFYVNRKRHGPMLPDVTRRRHAIAALLYCACAAVNAHFNLYMNETETWRLLGKSVR